MKDREGSGFFRWAAAASGGVLLRCIQGKSGNGYLRRFAGDDEYWEQAVAAQLCWRREGRRSPVNDPRAGQDPATSGKEPGTRAAVRGSIGKVYEPVYGWTERQLDGYLARNPGFRSDYESAVASQESVKPTRSERAAVLSASPEEEHP